MIPRAEMDLKALELAQELAADPGRPGLQATARLQQAIAAGMEWAAVDMAGRNARLAEELHELKKGGAGAEHLLIEMVKDLAEEAHHNGNSWDEWAKPRMDAILSALRCAAPEQESFFWEPDGEGIEGYGSMSRDAQPGSIKLYTHADPSEAERLRAELADALAARDKWGSNFQKAISAGAAIEQKLADAQALLRRAEAYVPTSTESELVEAIASHLSATAQPAECCTPTEAELKLIADGEYRAEELWGGSRPTCPKCIGKATEGQNNE